MQVKIELLFSHLIEILGKLKARVNYMLSIMLAFSFLNIKKETPSIGKQLN